MVDLDILIRQKVIDVDEWLEYKDLPCYVIFPSEVSEYNEPMENMTIGFDAEKKLKLDTYYEWDRKTPIISWFEHECLYDSEYIEDKYKKEMGIRGVYDNLNMHMIGHSVDLKDVNLDGSFMFRNSPEFENDMQLIYETINYWINDRNKVKMVDEYWNFCYSVGINRYLVTLNDGREAVVLSFECLQAEEG